MVAEQGGALPSQTCPSNTRPGLCFNSVLFSLVNRDFHSIRVFADHPSLSPRPSQMDTANSDGMDEGKYNL